MRSEARPFNQQRDTGRMGFRYEWEAPDERPLVVYREQFWTFEEERIWTRAVRSCPLSEYGHLDLMDYLAEVGKVARGLGLPEPGPLEGGK